MDRRHRITVAEFHQMADAGVFGHEHRVELLEGVIVDKALVIEVADSSYRIDRSTKWAIYAAAGVPAYWILDLNRSRLEAHTEPRDGAYTRTALLGRDDEVPLILDGRETARFAVRDILP
jgi:hypothetical protein